MALIEWTDELSVRVREFDEHHKQLIALINRLEEAHASGQQQAVIDTVLTELTNYTIYHFLGEEEVLAQFGYPGLEEQQKEHIALTSQVLQFRDEVQQHPQSVGEDMLAFLQEWLRHHILETDMQYAAFLNEHGVH